MYCQNCGSKVSESMDFCQTCGAKLIKSSETAKVPAVPESVISASLKKLLKNDTFAKKLAVVAALVLLSGIILIVVFKGVLGRDSDDEDFDDVSVPDVLLRHTYVNDAEGFSFLYPDGWVVEEGGGWLAEEGAESDDSIIMGLTHTSSVFGIRTAIVIEKGDADESYFTATASDYEEVFSGIYSDYKVVSLKDVTLSGCPARKIVFTYDNDYGEDCVAIQYFYIVNLAVYCVSCSSIESIFDSNEPIFDAIMGSYTITAVDWTGESADDYEDVWGWEEELDDSYPILGYGLEWVEMPYVTTDELGYSVINGVIENTSGSSKSWIMIRFDLSDANGYQIDQAVDFIQDLKSGGKWKFSATVLSKDAAYWDFADITVY